MRISKKVSDKLMFMAEERLLLGEDVIAAFPEYKIAIPPLGEGGFKAAFLASDGQKEFVLKILFGGSPEPGDEIVLDQRFIREIQIMSSLKSPRIVQMYAPVNTRKIGNSEMAWYGEPHYSGGSLDSILQSRRLTSKEVTTLAFHLLEGLQALESASIIHRDIKPGNICQTAEGGYVILDLGIAQVLTMEPLTATGFSAPMSRFYAAPEQFFPSGQSSVDARTDLFAAGIVLFEAVSGRHPFLDSTNVTFDTYMDRLTNHQPGQLSEYGCDPILQAVIDRCLASRQNRRFRNITQALTQLKELKNSL